MSVLVVGIDPGMTTGLLADVYDDAGDRSRDPIAVQIHGHLGVVGFVEALLEREAGSRLLLGVEKFVVSQRASRSRFPQAGRITRELIGALQQLGDAQSVPVHLRPAAVVKTWASDKRLAAAGLLEPTKGMQHARDAARQALYTAVHEHVTRDPLSRAVTR